MNTVNAVYVAVDFPKIHDFINNAAFTLVVN